MISITDIEPNNYSKLAKEGFRLKKLQFSHQGHFLCFVSFNLNYLVTIFNSDKLKISNKQFIHFLRANKNKKINENTLIF